jgi:hypothetical protein
MAVRLPNLKVREGESVELGETVDAAVHWSSPG